MESYGIDRLQSWADSQVSAHKRLAFIGNDFAIIDDIYCLGVMSRSMRLDMAVMGICLNGEFKIKLNTKETVVKTNDYVVLAPDQVTEILSYSRGVRGIFICLSNRLFGEMLTRMHDMLPMYFYIKNKPCAALDEADVEWIKTYHHLLFQELQTNHRLFRKEIAMGLMTTLFYKICNIYGSKHAKEETSINTRQEEIFSKFINLLSTHYKVNHDLQFYAEQLCITSKYLSAAIKNISGLSAGEWVSNYLIQEAKVQLKTTNRSIQSISTDLGFPNQSFFGKYFKHHTGDSPLSYRRHMN